MKVSIWENCYSKQWRGLITTEAFSHPAKFSPGLMQKIYSHCIEQGYVHKGGKVSVTKKIIKEIKQELDNNLFQLIESD